MEQPTSEQRNWLSRALVPSSTLLPALVGSVLCFLAQPPASLSLLGWIGTIPWLVLIALKELPGTRPYCKLWMAGFVYWLLTVHWIRLPHPANYAAWIALATYLGIYLPAFVALARVGVHRWRLPLTLVAPITYVGVDWLRGWIITGFSLGSLCHSQAYNPWAIQIADLGGEYTVTFVLLIVAASLTCSLHALAGATSMWKSIVSLTPALFSIAFILGYGAIFYPMLSKETVDSLRVALIQGDIRADWKSDIQKQQRIMDEYETLTEEALSKDPNIDLVIWPETMFRWPLVTVEPDYTPPPDLFPPDEMNASKEYLKSMVDHLQTSFLVGIDRIHFEASEDSMPRRSGYNSSVLIDRHGNNLGTYDKMHLVPFGEFIPFADSIPLMRYLTPVAGGAVPGVKPSGMLLDDILFVPNICYESAVPRLIRRQVNAVQEEFDRRPDVLVNLTNDAWYWGSSQLDQHLACSIFRAVEMRLPHLMVANGGLTAHINPWGTVEQVTDRQTSTYLIADVILSDTSPTLYSRWGNWLALPCVVCCVVLSLSCFAGRRESSDKSRELDRSRAPD